MTTIGKHIDKLVTTGKKKEVHTNHILFSRLCNAAEIPLGFSAWGSDWIKYVNHRDGKTLAIMAYCEISIYVVCQMWAGRRILYTAHQSHLWSHLLQDTVAMTAPHLWTNVCQIPATLRALSSVKSWQILIDVRVNMGTPASTVKHL